MACRVLLIASAAVQGSKPEPVRAVGLLSGVAACIAVWPLVSGTSISAVREQPTATPELVLQTGTPACSSLASADVAVLMPLCHSVECLHLLASVTVPGVSCCVAIALTRACALFSIWRAQAGTSLRAH